MNLGPEDPNNAIFELSNGDHSTYDWGKLFKKTTVLFQWRHKVVNKMQQESVVIVKNMDMMFCTRKSVGDKNYCTKELNNCLKGVNHIIKL